MHVGLNGGFLPAFVCVNQAFLVGRALDISLTSSSCAIYFSSLQTQLFFIKSKAVISRQKCADVSLSSLFKTRFTLEEIFRIRNFSGFINFRVFGFVGVFIERILSFLNVYTRQRETKCRPKSKNEG